MEFHIHDRMSVVECQTNSCWGKERETVVGRRKEGREGERRGREGGRQEFVSQKNQYRTEI